MNEQLHDLEDKIIDKVGAIRNVLHE